MATRRWPAGTTAALLALTTLVAGCAAPPELLGTWRLDVPACKAYYASVNWPCPGEEEWWEQAGHSRLQFSGSTMILRTGMFTEGSTNAFGTLRAKRIRFTLSSASNGTYEVTYFDEAYGKEVDMTLVVTGDHMQQVSAPDGVAIKYFWTRE